MNWEQNANLGLSCNSLFSICNAITSFHGCLIILIVLFSDTGAGTIYTSDSDGIIYSTSLEKHLVGIKICSFYSVIALRN